MSNPTAAKIPRLIVCCGAEASDDCELAVGVEGAVLEAILVVTEPVALVVSEFDVVDAPVCDILFGSNELVVIAGFVRVTGCVEPSAL